MRGAELHLQRCFEVRWLVVYLGTASRRAGIQIVVPAVILRAVTSAVIFIAGLKGGLLTSAGLTLPFPMCGPTFT